MKHADIINQMTLEEKADYCFDLTEKYFKRKKESALE